ncbi:MAG: efflux RND transporter permease subunit [Planctomycetes bacterium]|nr:efflux RND transporter permease subunit [Planctomycetota bacterium]
MCSSASSKAQYSGQRRHLHPRECRPGQGRCGARSLSRRRPSSHARIPSPLLDQKPLVAASAVRGRRRRRAVPAPAARRSTPVSSARNNPVQVNAVAPSFSPYEVERKQVTFPMENALAGIPGLESTRSLSRNGFAQQVTAVFEDGVDMSFARQQVGGAASRSERKLAAGRRDDQVGRSTGLGEVYMYTVEYEHPRGNGAVVHDGAPGWQCQMVPTTPEASAPHDGAWSWPSHFAEAA